jgi:P27 family predicted phage terminase small subunit
MARKAPTRPEIAPPDWLSPEAAEVWARTLAQRPGADPDLLVVYCCAVADFNRSQGILDRSGPLIQGQKGNLVRNPLQTIKTANAAVIRNLARDLGLHDEQPAPAGRYRNQSAAERTIAALRQTGKIEAVDEATLALVRTVAGALDQIDPEGEAAAMASLARVQLSALKMLRGQPDDTDSLAAVLAGLSAQMGDAEIT